MLKSAQHNYLIFLTGWPTWKATKEKISLISDYYIHLSSYKTCLWKNNCKSLIVIKGQFLGENIRSIVESRMLWQLVTQNICFELAFTVMVKENILEEEFYQYDLYVKG